MEGWDGQWDRRPWRNEWEVSNNAPLSIDYWHPLDIIDDTKPTEMRVPMGPAAATSFPAVFPMLC